VGKIIRDRLWTLLHYDDAIRQGIRDGITHARIAKALEVETGMTWHAHNVRTYLYKQSGRVDPSAFKQRPLPSLYDGPVRSPSTDMSTPSAPSVSRTHPRSRMQPSIAEDTEMQELPASYSTPPPSAPITQGMPSSFALNDFDPESYEPCTLLGDPISIDEETVAQWGAWLNEQDQPPMWYECEITHSSGFSVRFGAHGYEERGIDVWIYERPGGGLPMISALAPARQRLTPKQVRDDVQISSVRPVLSASEYDLYVAPWFKWFIRYRLA